MATKTRKRKRARTAASSRGRRSAAGAPLSTELQPEAGRPHMEGYGVPSDSKGMLRWADAAARLERSRNYWIVTARPDGRPHAVPVWGIWLGGAVYFGTDPRSRKAKNLAANPSLVIHLESGDDAVILEGAAEEVDDRGLIRRLDQAYSRKYKMRLTDAPGHLVIYAVRPRVAFGWRERDFPRSPTRWRFP
jgi:general stress protein 26